MVQNQRWQALDIELEFPNCPLCGSDNERTRFIARDRLVGGPGEFPVVDCSACGFVYLKPRPSPNSLPEYYPDAYYPVDERQETPEALAVARGLLTRLNQQFAGQDRRGLRLLDIGCGTGLFLKFARDAGYGVSGLEPSQSAVEYARRVYGLPVECGHLLQTSLPDGTFDAVVMWHVLEHLPDPLEALRTVHRVLKPGGLFLFAVPNIDSLEARVFGRRWFSLDAPRHLVHFSPETVSRALSDAGFRLDRVTQSAGTAGMVYSIMGDLTGISLRLRRRAIGERSYHRIASLLSWIVWPVCLAAAGVGRGGALEVYARRAGNER